MEWSGVKSVQDVGAYASPPRQQHCRFAGAFSVWFTASCDAFGSSDVLALAMSQKKLAVTPVAFRSQRAQLLVMQLLYGVNSWKAALKTNRCLNRKIYQRSLRRIPRTILSVRVGESPLSREA